MAKKPEFRVIDAPAREFRFKLAGSDELHRLPSVEEWCPGLVDSLTLEQFTEVVEAWFTASGITLGESAASAS